MVKQKEENKDHFECHHPSYSSVYLPRFRSMSVCWSVCLVFFLIKKIMNSGGIPGDFYFLLCAYLNFLRFWQGACYYLCIAKNEVLKTKMGIHLV